MTEKDELPQFLHGIDIPAHNIVTHPPNPASGVRRVEVRLGRASIESDTGPDNRYRPHPELEITQINTSETHEAPYPAMASTSDYLNLRTETYNEIGVGNYGFNDKDMASFGFIHCEAFVMRSRDPQKAEFRGVAHITSGANPEEYVDNLVTLFGTESLEAIVIRTGHAWGDELLQALRARGVTVIGTYEIPAKEPTADNRSSAHAQDIIVHPEQAKVILNIANTGMREIDF